MEKDQPVTIINQFIILFGFSQPKLRDLALQGKYWLVGKGRR